MKRRSTKIMSLLLAIAMSMANVGSICANAATTTVDPTEWADYVPSDTRPENLVSNGTNNAARLIYASSPRNSHYVTLGNTTDKWIASATGGRYDTKTFLAEPTADDIANGYEKIDLPENTTSEFAGYWINTGMLSISGFDKDKSYVVSFKVKNAGTTENVKFGIGMSNYSTATESYSKEYGAEGMALTSEYQTFNGTIKPSADFNADAKEQGIIIGMPVGTKVSSRVHLDLTDDDAVYIAEETA